MNDIIETIDARGLSCPQPILLTTQKAISMKKGMFRILIDTKAQEENVIRVAGNLGWKVTERRYSGNEYRVVVSK